LGLVRLGADHDHFDYSSTALRSIVLAVPHWQIKMARWGVYFGKCINALKLLRPPVDYRRGSEFEGISGVQEVLIFTFQAFICIHILRMKKNEFLPPKRRGWRAIQAEGVIHPSTHRIILYCS